MKTTDSFYQIKHWIKSSFALLPVIFLILMSSCQKEGFDKEMYPAVQFMNAALEPSGNTILYYDAETFKILSGDEPLVATRTLTNPDFKYFENFVLKVQNGKGNSNKNVTLEILIDDVLIVSSADFSKGNNIIQKELPGLKQESKLEVRLEGAKNKSVTLLIECSLQEDVISDIDGNYYKTVKIGEQWWMAENLKVTKFNDGTPIKNVTDDAEWADLWRQNYAPAYCWYNNDPVNKNPYGALYSRGAVTMGSGKNVCPVGWHIPDGVEDCMIMFLYLDPEIDPPFWFVTTYTTDVGNKLKEAGTEHWNCIENAATNESGFTALPGGRRVVREQQFTGIGQSVTFWADGGYAMFILGCQSESISVSEGGGEEGFSVRCVKD